MKMNKKDIENMIRLEKNYLDVPDLKEQIKKKINYVPKETVIVPKKKGFSFTKFSIAFVTVFLLLCIPFFFKLNNENYVDHNEEIDFKKAYAFQAASLFNFASSDFNNEQVLVDNEIVPNYNEISKDIYKYLLTIEDIFNKDNNSYKLVVLDSGEYKYQVNLNINLGSYSKSYILYFNETKENVDDDKDMDEVSTNLVGIVKSDDDEFSLAGKKVIENDQCEVELKLFLDSTKANYIKLEQELENGENEYTYEFYQNNELTGSLEMELNILNDVKKIELEVFDSSMKIEDEYEFTYFKDFIKVEFENENVEVEADIVSNENEYIFKFKDSDQDIIISKNEINKNILNFTNNIEDLIVL